MSPELEINIFGSFSKIILLVVFISSTCLLLVKTHNSEVDKVFFIGFDKIEVFSLACASSNKSRLGSGNVDFVKGLPTGIELSKFGIFSTDCCIECISPAGYKH